MKRRLFTVLLSCLVLGVLSGAASGEAFKMKTVLDEPGINQETLAKLIADGQLLIVRENKAGRLKLITSGILIDAEDIGGGEPRTIHLEIGSGRVWMSSNNKTRNL